jgi:hypothetical protein
MSRMRCRCGLDMGDEHEPSDVVANYLKEHPEIAEALRTLELSASQYGKTMNKPRIVVTDSTNSYE